jgi:hypothetical protein
MIKINTQMLSTIFLMTVSVSMIAAINLNQAFAQNPSNPDPNVLKGSITSTSNNGNTTEPAWILGGVYKITDINSSSPVLNTTFYMTQIDGSAEHTHSIYDLKLSGDPIVDSNSNSTTFNGTTTVTLKDGPVTNVPTQINLLDNSAIAISVDGNMTNDHFGTTPIYGTQHLICVEIPELCA